MKVCRLTLFLALLWLGALAAVAQDDPAREFFSAYQEYQRAERLEREGRGGDALAKFRFVATQLGQIRSRYPDWQPLVVDFRLRKTEEAVVRLEGSAEADTLGLPPDLPSMDGEEESLPPVVPPRREGTVAPPTISITPVPVADDDPNTPLPASGDTQRLQRLVEAERSRIAELEARLQQGEAELSSVSMELEKTRAERIDLAAQLKILQEADGVPAELQSGLQEEVTRLTEAAKELEESLAAAAAEKEDLEAKVAANAAEVEELTAQLETVRTEVETTQARVTELEEEKTQLATERDEAVAQAETAKEEVQTLTARVGELEEERAVLVAARDEAQQEAAEAKSALEKSADLIAANQQLEERLADAARQIEGMESDATARQEMIASLQADLDTVRGELTSAQDRLKSDRERFDQLQAVSDQLLRQYDQVTGELASIKLGEVTAAEAKLIQQENELLLGIIRRGLKEQARREQAYRLAQEEMDRLEVRSESLHDKISSLAQRTIELTPEEEDMLRRPVVTLLAARPDNKTAVVELLKLDAGNLPAAQTTESGEVAEGGAEESLEVTEVATEETGTTVAAGETDTTVVEATTEAVEVSAELQDDAAVAAASLSTAPPAEVLALVNEARDQFINGNFAAAEELYQKFVDLQPDNLVALANLGVAQFRQGKLTAAQLALERAISIDPHDSFSLTTLGAVLIEQNRVEDAMAFLERANEVSADDPITLNYLGVAASQLNQFGKAEQSLRRAITVHPEYAEAHFNLAVIYATAKPPSIALAKRHYERALELGSSPDRRLADLLQSNADG